MSIRYLTTLEILLDGLLLNAGLIFIQIVTVTGTCHLLGDNFAENTLGRIVIQEMRVEMFYTYMYFHLTTHLK